MKKDPFAAIADPTRRSIIALLAESPRTVNEIAAGNREVSRQAVSKHIHYLEACGLIRQEKEGRQIMCYVQWEGLSEVNDWLAQYEKFWRKKLDQLGAFLDAEEE